MPRVRSIAALLATVAAAACSGDDRPRGTNNGSATNNGPGSMPADAGASGNVVGQPCGAQCAAPAFSREPFCLGTPEDQYCSALCDISAQCGEGFECVDGGPEGVRYCQRAATPPPRPGDERLGQACQSNADCGGTDGAFTFAEPFCEPSALVCSRYCLDDCPSGFVCSNQTPAPSQPETNTVCLPSRAGPPSDPRPADGVGLDAIQTAEMRLAWVYSAPGEVTYDVYFGPTNTPPLVASGLTENRATVTVEPGTAYFWRVVVSNGDEGPLWSFVTSDTFLTVPCRDAPTVRIGGRDYGTADVGGRCWTTENVVVGTRASGTVYDDGELEYFCTNDAARCGYYTWRELNGYTGTAGGTAQICPAGWHVPTRNDWLALQRAYEGNVDGLVNGRLGFGLERDDRFQPRDSGQTCNLPGANPPRQVDCTQASLQETRGNAVGWYWSGSRSTNTQQGSVEIYFENREFRFDYDDTPIEFGLSVRCVRD